MERKRREVVLMQEFITVWQTGLFYSKFMLIFWITVPLMALIILHFLEKYLEKDNITIDSIK